MAKIILSIISISVSIIALFISWTQYKNSENQTQNIRFTDKFNDIYTELFSIRTNISTISNRVYGQEFYFEIDLICSNSEIEEYMLDVLTKLENFFILIPENKYFKRDSKTKVSFKKLVSKAFYQRILILYSYVLYKRDTAKNNELFSDFERIINDMSKMDKIKEQNIKDKVYIGVRESDIYYARESFSEHICLFSNDDYNKFLIRPNQNINKKEIPLYYRELLHQKTRNKNSYIFYNPIIAYEYPEKVRNKTLCLNDYDVLSLFNNKLLTKELLQRYNIPVVPYETFLGRDILISKLSKRFNKVNTFIVQAFQGGGGIGTFFLTLNNYVEVKSQIQDLQQYIVSPYITNVSVNVHLFISDKQTILSPGSIQIIEEKKQQLCYRGCDFISYRRLSSVTKEKIKHMSLKIANILRNKEYRGIAGIDFMVDANNNLFVSEINPRFQASTFLLDMYLHEKSNNNQNEMTVHEARNCIELNEMAFSGAMLSTLNYYDEINLSCYYYYSDGIKTDYFKLKYDLYQKNKVDVFLDGANYYLQRNQLDDNSYLYRTIFRHSICEISPDYSLWINDNIKIVEKPQNALELKVALLNQGVRLEIEKNTIKLGVYNSIDIKTIPNDFISEAICINCAYNIHLSKYSPFSITEMNNIYSLFYYNEFLCNIKIEQDMLANLSSIDKEILYVATDRLRIKIVHGCEQKNIAQGCKFCDIPMSKRMYTEEQIIEALNHFKHLNIPINHLLIGGGSRIDDECWITITHICNHLKQDDYYKNMSISLMSILPPENVLFDLKNAGISEVAFNVEIANENIAQKLMPGKRKNGKDAYYYILKKSVDIFGVGKVRSALLVGIDTKEELYNEILTLAQLNVIPCLSAIRILPNTELTNYNPPDNKYLLEIYLCATNLLKNADGQIHELGPLCKNCRNNMLVL